MRAKEAETKMWGSPISLRQSANNVDFYGVKSSRERHPLLFGAPMPCGFTHTDTFFCTHHSNRAKQQSPAHAAATFQQRPHINTTDLILEMARKEKKERKEGRKEGSYKRRPKSFATRNSRHPPSGFTFGRRFITHFFTCAVLASTDVWGVHAHYPFLFQSQSVSTQQG